MDMNHVDLNLLLIFEAMLEHQSVTRAGQAVGLSQPAMSAALAKLRSMLNDPLFVRTGVGMKPTPRAQDLAPSISRVLDIMRTQVLHESNFDAAVATRTFTINTPDIGEMVFLPKLLKRLSTVAPSIRLRATTVPHEQLETALETGKVDLAVGYFPDLTKAEIFQQRLFSHSFVCVVREDQALHH